MAKVAKWMPFAYLLWCASLSPLEDGPALDHSTAATFYFDDHGTMERASFRQEALLRAQNESFLAANTQLNSTNSAYNIAEGTPESDSPLLGRGRGEREALLVLPGCPWATAAAAGGVPALLLPPAVGLRLAGVGRVESCLLLVAVRLQRRMRGADCERDEEAVV